MADVFISHSSKDSELANKVCELLEDKGAKCWIAPRDITPGSDWAAEISKALSDSDAFLLIYTENSASSGQVPREIGIAEKNGMRIIPYRVDNTSLAGAFEYYLTAAHWIIANPENGDYKADELYSAVTGLEQHAPESSDIQTAAPAAESVQTKSSEGERKVSTNILCQREERYTLTTMYERLSEILKDSDDTEELERFKKALQNMANPTMYMAMGESGVGKTCLLSAIFSDIINIDDDIEGDICEYRWGEQDFKTSVNNGFQKKFIADDNLRGLSVIDSKGLNVISPSSLEKARQLTESCSAIFVVFDAAHITSPKLWDIIESFPQKNMVFFLTKCDMTEADKLAKNLDRLKAYMKESNVSAPVFAVSTNEELACEGFTPMENVRRYIRDSLVGANPALTKQRQNVEECHNMLVELKRSFERRKLQYESDARIMQKINRSMDNYVLNHKKTINELCNTLAAEINKDVDSYQNEIISKLDPYKIKERFKKQSDFEEYLNSVNDNYKQMMTNSVNQKVIDAIKGCLADLEKVFKEAAGYFNERENILALNDRFYSSLSVSRKEMVKDSNTAVTATGELYNTMSNASYELFMKIWEERKKYDRGKTKATVLGAVGGAVTAGAAATAILAATGAFTTTVTTGTYVINGVAGAITHSAFTLSLSSVLIIAVSAIAAAVVISMVARTIYSAKAGDKMEAAVRQAVAEFKDETNKTRMEMIKSVTNQVTEIFEHELAVADSCFTDFRISVNTDEMKIPQLENKIRTVSELLSHVEAMYAEPVPVHAE